MRVSITSSAADALTWGIRHPDQGLLGFVGRRITAVTAPSLTLRTALARWHGSTATDLQTPLRKSHDLRFTILALLAVILGLNVFLADFPDSSDNVVGLVDCLYEFRVAGFEELKKRPDRNVLECWVAGCEEAGEIAVDPAGWLVPGREE